ncbi:DUF4359 domain-containing protein [Cronbergia sp. UHCC 0137]|uniref:DUF4359 domain-containing protein n=1 Tax=Cronbergia sp. UHCC 0137 TaxID=3110239 RepID=UPI002B21EC20|nr:DUF4359 domain-containing protein [Cronbergia sp. UHCC 0137]MEA5619360.1 DUF4359 domain-containing protein [Cronbergia sp. UHCC 0137]
MKTWTIIKFAGATAIAVLGVIMAKTNPDQVNYEAYAIQRLTQYLKTDVCQKAPNFLERLIKFNCHELVDSANPQIREIIARTTERQNYLIFSVYRTELKLNALIPNYKFETVGAFDNFYTYKAKQQ